MDADEAFLRILLDVPPGLPDYLAGHVYVPFLLLGLLLLSGLVSGFEVAFFSLEQDDFQAIHDNPTAAADRLLTGFSYHPKKLLATILIANNAVNMALILLSASFFLGLRDYLHWPEAVWVVLETLIIGSLLLLLGEITPKVYAANRPLAFLRRFALVMRLFYGLFFPLAWLLAWATRWFEQTNEEEAAEVSNQELTHAIDLTSEDEAPPEEKQILKALVNLNNIPVRAIMRPRIDIKALDWNFDAKAVRGRIQDFGYSRIPVYEENLDTIRGILYIKDFLALEEAGSPQADWRSIVRSPYFVPESTKINRLLTTFQERRLHIAVVVDEFGGTSGIITLQDILEEIFGEIHDEFDRFDHVFSRLGQNSFLFDGKMPLLDVCRVAELPGDCFDDVKGENDSIGGLVLELNGRFPEQGQVIQYRNFSFEVVAVTSKVIKQVKLSIQPMEASTEAATEA